MVGNTPGSARRVAGTKRRRPDSRQEARSRKKLIGWIGGIATAAVAAFAAAFMTGVGNVAASNVTRPAAPGGLPARIDLVSIVRGPGDTHLLADPVALSADDLGQLNALNQTDPAYQAWFTSHHAVDSGSTDIELIVEGNRTHTVRIVAIQPVVSCAAPLSGTLFLSPSAGSDTSTQLLLDLDNPHALPSYVAPDASGNATSGKDFFGSHTVSLTQGEQFTFKLVASSRSHYCTFTLDVTALDGDQSVIEHVDNNGTPFAVSALLDNDPTNPGPGEYSAYQALYVGGIANAGQGTNSFGDVPWAQADPQTYNPGAP